MSFLENGSYSERYWTFRIIIKNKGEGYTMDGLKKKIIEIVEKIDDENKLRRLLRYLLHIHSS